MEVEATTEAVEATAAAAVVGVSTSEDSIEDVAAPFEDKKGKGNKIPFR